LGNFSNVITPHKLPKESKKYNIMPMLATILTRKFISSLRRQARKNHTVTRMYADQIMAGVIGIFGNANKNEMRTQGKTIISCK
jgi:DNA-directed RNA polymerase specialized sigma24 family protein